MVRDVIHRNRGCIVEITGLREVCLIYIRPPKSTHCVSSAASDVYKGRAEFHTPLISLEEFYTQQCLQLPNRLRQGRLTDGENIGGKDDLSQSRYFQKAVQVSEL